ncbi:O-antigen ligase family protein [Gemella haemolysans]|uniref:sunset domain-containing protein n=1 Tax=Gemella haemolysans TaxID=1379 RepID=UPI00195B97DB|nr:O-antigen ligase family protein [Gemella haemolysans]VTX76910.1 Uncharacterised protein [Gemella haemolysans]
MNKFIKEHGQVILWFIFLVFMLISLSMVFTHGIRYAVIVFVLSFILLCPPIAKLIQRKTRLKKVVLGVVSALVMMLTMLMTNHFSEARKEEQRKTFQEKKEERDKKLEEQSSEEKKEDNSDGNKEQQVLPHPASKNKIDEQDEMKNEPVQLTQTQQNKQQPKKVVVRASKKSGVYYTPTHPSYNNVAARNLLVFSSEEAAQRAGYRRAA